ncbi:MAG: ClpXP protease specificity-enhancing factor [Wenzhouxiangellaceae bacterium]
MTDKPDAMSPSQPYLLRALNEWIIDNGMTPQILLDADAPGVEVPAAALGSDSKVVLNISPTAVRDLLIDNDYVSFVARFSGVSHGVLVPVDAIKAIYARENGQGMMFPESPREPDAKASTSSAEKTDKSSRSDGKPNLKVIK